MVSVTDPHGYILGFLARSLYFFFQVAQIVRSWTQAKKFFFSPLLETSLLYQTSGKEWKLLNSLGELL
jgi:hypothetical protein